MQHFKYIELQTQDGDNKKHLKAVDTNVLTFITDFTSNMLGKIVNRRNHLKYYRNTITSFRESFDALFADINFSENLSVLVKFEPQSLHWSYKQVHILRNFNSV